MVSRVPATFKDVLDRFPDRRELALAIEVKPATLAGWYRRDSIRSIYWQKIEDAARSLGIKGANVRVLNSIASTRVPERHHQQQISARG